MVQALEGRTLLSTTIVVNTILDTAHPGFTSLRDAVVAANGTPNTTITFSPTVFATAKTITLAGSPLVITGTGETIKGPAVGVTVSANNLTGVFYCGLVSGNFTLQNLTITKGSKSGVSNAGTATLNNVTVTGNAGTTGDGVYNGGTMTIINSTISANAAPGSVAGGIYNAPKATLTLTNSTVLGNSSGEGAGIDNLGTANLTNVTISGNTCAGVGGGIYNNNLGKMTLDNVTISGNSATSGGGLLVYPATTTTTLANTVIAGNTLKVATLGQDVSGVVTSQGFNFIGKTDGSTGWIASDFKGTIAHPLVPNLGPLANNGGPTFTMLPLAGSPLINKGSNALIRAGSTTDQRGLPRIANTTVDIGAVEVPPPAGSIAGTVFSDTNGNGHLDTGEHGLANVKVYLDTNKNGAPDASEAFVLTDASGNFKFNNLAPNTYRVREVLPAGNALVAPILGYYDIPLAAGGTSVGSLFADTPASASIAGRVFNDVNGNGLRDVGEAGLGLFKVYIDFNNNGLIDGKDISVTTDVLGNWSFTSLIAGKYTIRVVPVAGLTVTKPIGSVLTITVIAGQASAGNLFGEKAIN
ncbi:MAG TPA: SdrD B-like domain-containing protein [Humisphaera sp.]|jgi:uncharacterized protein (DUF2141 family)|nr:SdrD B-like domain-containing protein [Humisphaera sp.]